MSVVFYVRKGGNRIYSLEFPVDDQPWQFSEFGKLGIDNFLAQHSGLSLTDPDIQFGFEPGPNEK